MMRVGVHVGLFAVLSFFSGTSLADEGLSGTGCIRPSGRLGALLNRMIASQLEGGDVDYLTRPFLDKTERQGGWQTEFWGKWMHSAVPFARYAESDRLSAAVDRSVERILESQEPDGYIGNYPEPLRCGEGWDVWGIKYTMMGLLHYVQGEELRTGTGKASERGSRALEACKRLCDYVIAELGPGGKRGCELWQTGNWSGYASSSILEPVMWLYRRTKDRRYLDFAAFVVEGMCKPESGPRLLDLALRGIPVADRNGFGNVADSGGGYVKKHNRWKAYEMMSCYQGLLEYHQAVGKGEFLNAALNTATDIVTNEVTLAGGCACCEAWFHGARKQSLDYVRLQETCVTTTWLRLCAKLLELTDNPQWADQMEKTFYNAYLGALKGDGSEFAAYTPLNGSRYRGMHHCHMLMDCCTANGPRGFLTFLRTAFLSNEKGITFNFYTSASARAVLPGSTRDIPFEMYSLYPRDDRVRIVCHADCEKAVPVRFRIPSWCKSMRLWINGEESSAGRPGSYLTVTRKWAAGDVFELQFPMRTVAHRLAHHVAFTRGPILLARDSRFGDGDLCEAFRQDINDGDVMENVTDVRSPSDDIWMAFSAVLPVGIHHENPEGRHPKTVFFCDYASAGNTWRRDDYYRTWFPVELGPTE